MKTIFLMRHAKSSWDDPGQTDFERPLNRRGLHAAPLMGAWLREKELMPDLIVSSPAARAAATARLVKSAADFAVEIRFDQRIYEASPARLSEVVAEQSDDFRSLLLVGHNPGLEGFLRFLTGKIEPLPTAAFAAIDLPIENWRAVNSDPKNRLRALLRPKEIF